MDERFRQLQTWLETDCGLGACRIEPASGDASFRRYFRVTVSGGGQFIAMDAPPAQEDCRPFVQLAGQLEGIGLHVPGVRAQDLTAGFLLLEDLGDTLYLGVLNERTADRLYGDALAALAVMQAVGPADTVPVYDRELLGAELELFRDWLCDRHLSLGLTEQDNRMLDDCFELLLSNALEQPQVFVHRDFHSRNLMVGPPPVPGILDFQDAVHGPVTYDLVSLLKDAYIRWPLDRIDDWAWGYFQLAVQSGVLAQSDERHFQRWFDLMGVQRHVKVAGIFARLYRRDGKSGYLQDVPLVLDYILEIAPRYPELGGLAGLIREHVVPALDEAA